MAIRRIVFLPIWLFVMLVIAGAGVYLDYRAPEVTAAVVIWTVILASAFALTTHTRWP